MTSLQAGRRALSLSVNVIMASTTFIKETAGCTGILQLLLLGLLLPSVLVSGQESTTWMSNSTSTTSTNTSQAPSNMTAGTTANLTTTQSPTTSESTIIQPSSSTTSGPASTSTTIQSPSTVSSNTETPVTESATSTTSGGTAISTITQSLTTTATSGGSTSTTVTQSPTTITTSGGPAISTLTQSPTTTSGGITSTTTTSGDMTQSSSNMTSMMSPSPSSNSTEMPNKNETLTIYCPSFTCNYSDCYTMYTSQNVTLCAAGVCYCQLIRRTDMWYAVSCSVSCAESCVNVSQTNCSVNCCNSTGCLNSSFESMTMTPTVISTTTTMAATAAPPTTQQTNNGNKCRSGTCTGNECYKDFVTQTAQMCSSSQPHCQLKKESVDSNMKWTAGCTTNCSSQTPCKISTQPPCHLECCNATTTSCLWLNGTLHVPNLSTRGPHHHTELIASSLCLLAITLLM
ncbi:cell wall protein DAN4 [Cyclopterus lumpus]|uniref:cell wall protein DAN4 n=1 Tax=Cyclopterus lumpus TaxID=8103 RepID=UPI00148714E6|nr:cell wall protein DAN4 [Cyclopterus lumpus]